MRLVLVFSACYFVFPGEQQTPSIPGVSGGPTSGTLRFSSGMRG